MSRLNLAEALGEPEKAPESPKDLVSAPKARKPRKTAQKPAQKRAPVKKSAKPATPAVKKASEPRAPLVRGVETKDAKRVTLYLHPDDYEFIRYDMRGGDIQSVMRSLIACARSDDRLRTKVSRLSREAPRGGGQ